MRFEHIIEINSPQVGLQTVVPTFSREQLWNGLMIRVKAPQRFPMGPERVDWTEPEPGVFQRTLHFGQHVFRDVVLTSPHSRLQFTPEAHGDTTPVQLTMTIEEPQAGRMVLRFVYEPLGELSQEEAYYNEYRHNAWLHNDRDMVRTLRQWLTDEGL
ncbi:AtaL-like protein [Aquabacterium sp.]|uniref:AtaL-like protein n=1 Tax=Aquabacterium sp. TaxID=1872578 RepID=UPI0035B40EB2